MVAGQRGSVKEAEEQWRQNAAEFHNRSSSASNGMHTGKRSSGIWRVLRRVQGEGVKGSKFVLSGMFNPFFGRTLTRFPKAALRQWGQDGIVALVHTDSVGVGLKVLSLFSQ